MNAVYIPALTGSDVSTFPSESVYTISGTVMPIAESDTAADNFAAFALPLYSTSFSGASSLNVPNNALHMLQCTFIAACALSTIIAVPLFISIGLADVKASSLPAAFTPDTTPGSFSQQPEYISCP